ncbi:cell adhesion molecule-like protein 2 [Plakobranchus ocellatus]|uniref:Cell adhesion molecule-like protein 2 n=1 Tax=Plakobranchus ocellatus TaxID=259542 RepID=A0AAV4AVV9_9GAST|nr:cell adhesion molecule-like protein 2 [Plakobranchus ocellatus]
MHILRSRLSLLCFLYPLMDFIGPVEGQDTKPIIAEANKNANLSFIIPDTDQVNSSAIIHILLDPMDGSPQRNFREIAFLGTRKFEARKRPEKVTVSASPADRRLTITVRNVEEADIGYYRCSISGKSTGIFGNCGQMLILPRQPGVPNVSMVPSSSIVVGEKLRLECQTKSNSLPPKHGLPSKIWWFEAQGNDIASGSRIYMNAQKELEVSQLQRQDKGRKFACKSADDTGTMPAPYLTSNVSSYYEILPEYAPIRSDLSITPRFEHGSRMDVQIGEVLRYECKADCNPPCQIKWLFKKDGERYGELPDLVNSSVLFKSGVSRLDQGMYRCSADNKHSQRPARQTFMLNVLYIESPQVFINELDQANRSVWEGVEGEDDEVRLKCIFDANPGPNVVWKSPAGIELITDTAQFLKEQADASGNGVLKRFYSSYLNLGALRCEATGVYSCHGSNGMHQVEGKMNIRMKCLPTPADIPGKMLQPVYVWETSQPLSFEFVMKGWPVPEITRVMSTLNNTRGEEINKDIMISTVSPYNDKPWLTLFRISIRQLTKEDVGRTFQLTFRNSDYVRDFNFKIYLRGPPHAVSDITVESVDYDSAELFWLPGFNGGEVQTFSVQYRKFEEVCMWLLSGLLCIMKGENGRKRVTSR